MCHACTSCLPWTVSLMTLLSFGAAHSMPTHCIEGEEVYFNCLVKGSKKVGSVCGAGYDFAEKQAGYLQYRFGAIGQIEFRYPPTTNTNDMTDRFNFSASHTADLVQWDSSLEFISGAHSYSISAGEEQLPGRNTRYSAAITVWKEGDRKGAKVLRCSNGDAGRNLLLNHVVPMMSSPGRKWSEPLW